jgi:UDP-glucose 4-epimerase
MTLAFITGAGGFIGRHLAQHLGRSGTRVAGLDLISADDCVLESETCGWYTGPLSQDGLTHLADAVGLPDTVYHLAGGSSVGASIADPYGDFTSTLGGTGKLLDWLRTHAPATRMVIVSSAAVYGDIHREQIHEDAATAPSSPYGAHKFAMEAIVRGWSSSFGIPAVAVRLFSVFGPGLRKQLLWDLSARLMAHEEPVSLGGSGDEVRDWIHVTDVVRALEVASGLGRVGMPILNAGSTIGSSVQQVSRGLARAFGTDPERIQFSGQARPGDPFSLVAAPGKLAETGFVWRTGLDEGLKGYADWYLAADRS